MFQRYKRKPREVNALQYFAKMQVDGVTNVWIDVLNKATYKAEKICTHGAILTEKIDPRTNMPLVLTVNSGDYVIKLPDGKLDVIPYSVFEDQFEKA
jgi:hypothetical protein